MRINFSYSMIRWDIYILPVTRTAGSPKLYAGLLVARLCVVFDERWGGDFSPHMLFLCDRRYRTQQKYISSVGTPARHVNK